MRGVAGWVEVEKANLFCIGCVRHVQQAKSRPVVGLVRDAVLDVQIVVNRCRLGRVGPCEEGVVQIFHVEEKRARVDPLLLLVELVSNHEVFVVFGEPPLVGVGRAAVALRRDEGGVGGVCDIHNRHGVFVARKGDFLALVLGVVADVVDHLSVVGVAILGERPCDHWIEWVGNVDDVEATGGGVGSHAVCPGGGFVDHDVVGVAKPVVQRVCREIHGRVGHVAKLGQVEHLHAVASRLRNDEGVVVVHLDVAPQRRHRCRVQVAQVHRVRGVGNVDEGCAIGSSQQHVFLAVEGIGPAPDVVHLAATDLVHAQGAQEVHVFTRVEAG